MKNIILTCLLLFASINAAQAEEEPLPKGYYIADVMFLRPLGLVTTVVGTAVFVGISPLTWMAAIAPPHDAYTKLADLMIARPARFTFDRPLGVYYADPDGKYRRNK